MDLAVGSEDVIEPGAIAHPMTVDENHNVGPQVALVIEYIAPQARIEYESGFQRVTQYAGLRTDFGNLGKAAQLLSKDELGHGGKLCNQCNLILGLRAQLMASAQVDSQV